MTTLQAENENNSKHSVAYEVLRLSTQLRRAEFYIIYLFLYQGKFQPWTYKISLYRTFKSLNENFYFAA